MSTEEGALGVVRPTRRVVANVQVEDMAKVLLRIVLEHALHASLSK